MNYWSVMGLLWWRGNQLLHHHVKVHIAKRSFLKNTNYKTYNILTALKNVNTWKHIKDCGCSYVVFLVFGSNSILLFSAHCQCQAGWRQYEDKCYFFSTDAKTWLEANAFCLQQNSNLMSIQDIHERVRQHTSIQKQKGSLTRVLSYFFSIVVLVVGEDTDQHRSLLDRPEWQSLRRRLGVEWRQSLCRIFIVRESVDLKTWLTFLCSCKTSRAEFTKM